MLKRFNDLYNKLLFENKEDVWTRKITKDYEFFNEYLYPLIETCNVQIVKPRLNTFRVGGTYENVIKFLKSFKVDNNFWNDEFGEFVVYSPMICFSEQIHLMDRFEGYPQNTVDPISLYHQNNFFRQVVEGKWYEPNQLDELTEFDYKIRAKYTTPKNFIKLIDNLIEELGYTKNIIVIIEFQINCECLINQCYDEMTTFKPILKKDKNNKIIDTADIMNDLNKMSEPTAKCIIPKNK